METPALRTVYAIRLVKVSVPHPSDEEKEEVDANLWLVVVDPLKTVRSVRIKRRQNWPQKVEGGEAVRIIVALGACGVGGLLLFEEKPFDLAFSEIAHCHILMKMNASSAPIPGQRGESVDWSLIKLIRETRINKLYSVRNLATLIHIKRILR